MSRAQFGSPVRGARSLGSVAAILILLCVTLAAAPSAAHGSPTFAQRLGVARAEAMRVQKILDDMDAQLEGISEAKNKVQEDLDKTDKAIFANQLVLDDETRKLVAAQLVLNQRVSSIYRAGDVDVVGVMLGTSSFDDLLARLNFLGRIANQDAQLKLAVEQAKSAIEAIRSKLEAQRVRQVELRGEFRAREQDLQARVAAKQRYLDSLNSNIQKLVSQERDRQRRLAEALARRALAGSKPNWYPKPGQVYPRDQVTQVALKQLGKPYLWGATGPDSFDCSGLMVYCYAYVGVYLPRTSQEQARFGTPVAKDQLMPGDLVYFGYGADPNRVHHIGMYIGGGQFVHAPRSGDVVKISTLSERDDYAGATRP